MRSRTIRGIVCALAGALVLSACSAAPAGDEPVPLIVDYSPTVSDVGALIYLLSKPDVNVIGITLPSTGEAGCDVGVEVTMGILALFDSAGVPVACDPEIPSHANEWPEAFVGGNDSLALALPDPIAGADPRPADELIVSLLEEAERPVVVYAVAPLTNVANALEAEPGIAEKIEEVVIMGGAIDVAGNVGETGAEWNLWIDVPAAVKVMSSDVPVTLVPLDATNSVPTPGLWDLDVTAAAANPRTEYLAAMLSVFPTATSGGFYLWDELAATVAAGEALTTIETFGMVVVDDQDGEYGATRRDPNGKQVAVAMSVPDPEAFYRHFLSTVSGVAAESRPILSVSSTDKVAIGADASPEQVLAFWVLAALEGDAARASDVVATEAGWPSEQVGLGPSADAFVAGSAPYGAFDIHLTCTSAETLALCDGTWNDKWLAANPAIDVGRIRVKASVGDGEITSFDEVSFNTEIGAAFDAHLSWLATNYPDRLSAACADGAAVECSQLLVDTAGEWFATADTG